MKFCLLKIFFLISLLVLSFFPSSVFSQEEVSGVAAPDGGLSPIGGEDPFEKYRRGIVRAGDLESGEDDGAVDSSVAEDAGASSEADGPVIKVEVKTQGFDDLASTDDFEGEFADAMNEAGSEQDMSEEDEMQSIRSEAFDAAITGMFPLVPGDIRKLLKKYDETNEAAKTPIQGMPRPEVVVRTVSLDPGAEPLVINTAIGHVTTLNILDVTGAPWPIQDVTWAGDFQVIEPEEGGHIIRITPMQHYVYGNMSIRLLTLKTPIIFTLKVSRESVHYRFDARVPEFGPFAKAPIIDGGSRMVAGNVILTSILDGIAPSGAVKLEVSGTDGRTSAYRVGDFTYVRTPLTMLSPGWEASVSSADGMNVYQMANTPVILLSDKGTFTRVRLKERRGGFNGR